MLSPRPAQHHDSSGVTIGKCAYECIVSILFDCSPSIGPADQPTCHLCQASFSSDDPAIYGHIPSILKEDRSVAPWRTYLNRCLPAGSYVSRGRRPRVARENSCARVVIVECASAAAFRAGSVSSSMAANSSGSSATGIPIPAPDMKPSAPTVVETTGSPRASASITLQLDIRTEPNRRGLTSAATAPSTSARSAT
jgi:hypothetical protein